MPGKKGQVGEGVSKMWIYFSLSYSDLIGNKLNYPKLSLSCP